MRAQFMQLSHIVQIVGFILLQYGMQQLYWSCAYIQVIMLMFWDQEPDLNNFFNYRAVTLCQRLNADIPFRRRFIHTACLLWAFFGLGWVAGQMGPSFTDLRLIIGQDLDTASWLFTVSAFGYMVGSLLGGLAYDRFNKVLLLAFSAVALGIFTGITPWCKWFPVMLIVKFISGLGAGGLDTGGNADVISLWDNEGRSYMQALHFFFGLGGIISPLATEPFLAEAVCAPDYHNDFAISTENTMNSSTNITTCTEVHGKSYVHYAYIITLLIVCSGAIPFFVMFVKGTTHKQCGMVADRSALPYPNPVSNKKKILFLTLLFLIFFTYNAIESTFSGYLATFCITYFKWDSGTSSFAASVHWTSFSVGRFSGIFLIKFFRPEKLFISYLLLLVLSFVGFLITSLTYSSEIFWLFLALPGFAMSVIFPCILTWTEENILKVSGLISSIFLIAASSGLMINPLFLGYLMDNKSPIWFSYILLGESCFCLATVLTVLYLSKIYVKISYPRSVNIEISVPEQVTHM